MLNVCFAIEKESNDAGEFSRVEKIYERNNEFFFSLFLRDNGLIESDKQTNVPCSQERRVNCKIWIERIDTPGVFNAGRYKHVEQVHMFRPSRILKLMEIEI